MPLEDGGPGRHPTALRRRRRRSTYLALVVELVRHHDDVPESAEQPDDPDFAQIYGTNESITPRLARRLWTAALFCADTWRLAADDAHLLVEDLPPVAWSDAVGPLVPTVRGLLRRLSDRIALGHLADDEVTICTGEEMALHLLIDFAQGEFDSGFDSDAEALDQLPDHWFWWVTDTTHSTCPWAGEFGRVSHADC